MFKKYFIHGLVSGILASLAAIIYLRVYFFVTLADFSSILGIPRIVGFNILYCLMATFLNWFLVIWMKQRGEIVFNFLFSILSFALIIVPISISLPLEIEFPELFPGLAIPIIFFPAIAWYTIVPFFREKEK
jgi:hypothetical protein